MIKSLEVIGTDNYFQVGVNGVQKIVDRSLEWENEIDLIYEVEDSEGANIARVENCPVVVTYKK